jgi:hypothetical protein
VHYSSRDSIQYAFHSLRLHETSIKARLAPGEGRVPLF